MRAQLNLWRLGYSAFFLLGHKTSAYKFALFRENLFFIFSLEKMSCEVDFRIPMYRRSSISPEGTVLRLRFLGVER